MIQVIQRALDIFEFLAKDPQSSKTLSEIADAIGVQPSTCANIVKTLVIRGYLEKTTNQRAYCLGAQWHNISLKNLHYDKLVEVAKAEIERLTNLLNENTSISILDNNLRKVILKKDSNQQIQAQTPDLKNAYDTSTGRLLLAMKTNDDLEKYIALYGLPDKKVWPEANTKNAFYQEMEKIRKLGYVLIEDSVQVIGFAAPIYFNERAIAALSIYMPAFRYSDKLRASLINLGTQTSLKIAELLKL